ncbi:hypothetical protein [Rubrobacter marinus]|uniref:hypothetical protein n=1 Tax=Rubrobacter marinus TaxID=2653852 RepID=UPI001A9E671D|nr:hypothetical protein [Rubrobacter marinus]
MSDEKQAFEGWAILELFGHRRLGGYVSEQELAGTAFVRIDVPDAEGEADDRIATQLYNTSAVYALTPTTEEVARAVAAYNKPAPVQRWELPAPREPERRSEYEGESFEEEPFDREEGSW